MIPMAGRFLRLFQPISRLTLEVQAPKRRVSFGERLLWTLIVLILYYVMSEIPLYGLPKMTFEDPMLAMRVIFASHRGTLMELGIGPIVTGGLILQLLVGPGIVECDMSNPEDRALFTAASKVFAILMTIFQASMYWYGGAWGTISLENGIFIFLQLLSAGMILILLDELLQKGWGIGSGISLFIAAGVAQTILWYTISPLGGLSPDGKLLGALPAFFQSLWQGDPLISAFQRPGGYPDMIGFLTTIVVFLIVIYLEGVRVELPITYARFRGFRSRFPVKLLYVSNIPVIFASTILANLYFGCQIVWSRFNQGNENPWLNLIGTFNSTSMKPTGGLGYYITSPRLNELMADPLRGIIFALILVGLCVAFSMIWLELGGMSPRDVAKQLVDSGVQIPGFRRTYRSVEEVLERYIPTVAILGGIIVGLIASIADFFNVFGSGMGILLTVGILYQYYQQITQERLTEAYPALRRLLGEE